MFPENYTEQDLAADKDMLLDILHKFARGVLQGDHDAAIETFAEDMVGIGLGEQGFYKSKSEAAAILQVSAKASPNGGQRITVEYGDIDIRISSPHSATITAEIFVIAEAGGKISKSGIMQMACAKKENGRWLFCLLTATPLQALTEENIEAYPLTFADETLSKLKGNIQSNTFKMMNDYFSSGILGTYVKENYPLYFVNDAFIGMLGYNREEFYEKFRDNTSQLNYQDDKEYMREFSKDGEKIIGEDINTQTRLLKKDGSYIWIDLSTRQIKDEDDNDIFLSIITDITENVSLRQKAEQANKAKGDFLAKMSHEIRTPMNAITGMSELLLMKELPEDVRCEVQYIKQASTSLISIINDILDGAGSEFTVIIPQEIDPNYFDISSAANTVWFTIPQARILIVDDLPTNLKVAEGLLAPYKAAVDTCLSGAEAIELVKHSDYDLVFMDHMMPEMDGIEACMAIRAWESERPNSDLCGVSEGNSQTIGIRRIPIVALTANAIVGMREMFLEKGFNDFFTKPIDVYKLNEILELWIPREMREYQEGKKLILLVDDNPVKLRLGINVLEEKYNVITASSAEKIAMILENIKPDVILMNENIHGSALLPADFHVIFFAESFDRLMLIDYVENNLNRGRK